MDVSFEQQVYDTLLQAQPVSLLDERLYAAKQYLGENYVLHPNYRFNPRRSNDPEIYEPARHLFLSAIRINAMRARQFNPASRDYRPDVC